MDLREQDERFSSGQRSRTCAATLKVLAVVGLAVGLVIVYVFVFSGNTGPDSLEMVSAIMLVFSALAMAALLWAAATGLRVLRHIEENTRGGTGPETGRRASTGTAGPASD